jgi:VIT1/CCC1 family predicted Fe2+/Mn2+ transporter
VRGNLVFLLGGAIEIVALQMGVDSWAVAVSVIAYGAVLLVTGYLS